MPLQPFTRNYEDNSTDAGFQFTFLCDICGDGYKTSFIQSKTYKKAGFWKGIGKAVSIGSELAGRSGGYTIERGTDAIGQRFEGMTPEWHKEHESPRTKPKVTSVDVRDATSMFVKVTGMNRKVYAPKMHPEKAPRSQQPKQKKWSPI
jgi:hypothetical protein